MTKFFLSALWVGFTLSFLVIAEDNASVDEPLGVVKAYKRTHTIDVKECLQKSTYPYEDYEHYKDNEKYGYIVCDVEKKVEANISDGDFDYDYWKQTLTINGKGELDIEAYGYVDGYGIRAASQKDSVSRKPLFAITKEEFQDAVTTLIKIKGNKLRATVLKIEKE